MDWTDGYVADIGYTYGYYTELNPLRIKLAFLSAGLAPPEVGHACELGYGQGLSTNLHAAATVTQWQGTDFNPSQAGFAQQLAAASGAGARLYDDGFAEFCQRPDLPDFDFICLHGIWSWISDQNRAVIVDFVRRKLKVGGVLYISYNTQPGWAPMVPLRHLLSQHAGSMSASANGIVGRVDAALGFTERLLATNPLYLRANPGIAERFARLKGMGRNYLAHEYFNRDWQPMPFADMAQWLAPAKLAYACPVSFIAHIDVMNVSDEQKALLAEIGDPVFRETARDFMLNEQFRKDYWVRGPRRLTALERSEGLRQLRVLLRVPRAEVALKATGVRGEANLNEAVHLPLLDALAAHKSKTLGQLEQELAPRQVSQVQLIEALMLLIDTGAVVLVQEAGPAVKARPHTDKLNAHLCQMARASNDVGYLASPVTGGGVAVGRIEQLFMLARSEGRKSQAEWVTFVWQVLSAQGHKLTHEGVTLEGEEQNLAALARHAAEFHDVRLPLLRALGLLS